MIFRSWFIFFLRKFNCFPFLRKRCLREVQINFVSNNPPQNNRDRTLFSACLATNNQSVHNRALSTMRQEYRSARQKKVTILYAGFVALRSLDFGSLRAFFPFALSVEEIKGIDKEKHPFINNLFLSSLIFDRFLEDKCFLSYH